MTAQTLEHIVTTTADETVEPETSIWSIVPGSAKIEWSARKKYFMLIPVSASGSFSEISGQIEMTGTNPETAHGTITIPVASHDSGQPKRDKHLQSANFFDAESHPFITFEPTRVQRALTGNNIYQVSGLLTARGQTRPVTLTGTFDIAPESTQAHVTFAGSINRQDFGMSWSVVPLMKLFDDILLSVEVDIRQS
jgi:polyisoprenoid-binding protein YceI